jgi:hypothetical protein
MTPNEFRTVALNMPNAVESSHMKHPDFRVGGKVFATLGYPDVKSGMVKLTPEQQQVLIAAEPQVFHPANGAWGKRGSTIVNLEALDLKTAQSAISMAWSNAQKS